MRRNASSRNAIRLPLRKKFCAARSACCGQIDLAFLQPLQQLVRGQIDQLDFIGALQHRVGHGLPYRDAGDLRDHIVEAFDVLDVDRGIDIDTRLQQFLHILPALGMARTRRIGVRQFVHQDQRRMALERGIQIELAQLRIAVFHQARRQDFQPFQQLLRLGALVRFHIARHHVQPFRAPLARSQQHAEGFADTGGGAEENLQAAAAAPGFGALHFFQQGIGIGTLVSHRYRFLG